jgi:IclR family acetate operon transcriptional repressor
VSTLALDMDMAGLETRASEVIAAARDVSAALGAVAPVAR